MGSEPLSAPEIYHIDEEETGSERFWKVVPVLGWAIQAAKWDARTRPIAEKIKRQLCARERPPVAVWGVDPQRMEIARHLCHIVQAELGWPNDHFIPADPVDVVLWAHEDGLDVEAAVIALEERLGIEISFEDVNGWFGQTMDDVVTWLQHHKEIGPKAS